MSADTILSIECSSPYLSIALQYNNTLSVVEQEGQRKHSENILPLIKQLLEQKQLSINEIDKIAVGIGPGSFIGVRLAHSIAQGLCFANHAELVTLSSLQIIAQAAALKTNANNIVVLQDARKNELYVGHFQLIDHIMQPVIEEQLMTPEAFNHYMESISDDIACIGTGIEAYAELTIQNQTFDVSAIELAKGAIHLAQTMTKSSVITEPNYVRNHVADLPKST